MILTNPTNIRWANAEHTRLDMNIEHSVFGVVDFSADLNDTEHHGVYMFNSINDNQADFVIADFDPWYWNPEHPDNPANQITVVEV